MAGYLLLRPFLNDIAFGIVFAAVAGIMVYVSLDELLPSAREYEASFIYIWPNSRNGHNGIKPITTNVIN